MEPDPQKSVFHNRTICVIMCIFYFFCKNHTSVFVRFFRFFCVWTALKVELYCSTPTNLVESRLERVQMHGHSMVRRGGMFVCGFTGIWIRGIPKWCNLVGNPGWVRKILQILRVYMCNSTYIRLRHLVPVLVFSSCCCCWWWCCLSILQSCMTYWHLIVYHINLRPCHLNLSECFEYSAVTDVDDTPPVFLGPNTCPLDENSTTHACDCSGICSEIVKQWKIEADQPKKDRIEFKEFGCPKKTIRFCCWVVGSNIVFIFTPIWGNDPIWLIFFKGVETTN